jgi:hypothetical protein
MWVMTRLYPAARIRGLRTSQNVGKDKRWKRRAFFGLFVKNFAQAPLKVKPNLTFGH